MAVLRYPRGVIAGVVRPEKEGLLFVDNTTLSYLANINALDILTKTERLLVINKEVKEEGTIYNTSPNMNVIQKFLADYADRITSVTNVTDFSGIRVGSKVDDGEVEIFNAVNTIASKASKPFDVLVVGDDRFVFNVGNKFSDAGVVDTSTFLNALLIQGGITSKQYFDVAAKLSSSDYFPDAQKLQLFSEGETYNFETGYLVRVLNFLGLTNLDGNVTFSSSSGIEVKYSTGDKFSFSADEKVKIGFLHASTESSPLHYLTKGSQVIDLSKFQCFVADTLIFMADQTFIPISGIKVGDTVQSFDSALENGRSSLVSKMVKKVFHSVTKTIIDLRGLRCTPGHVFLSGDSSDFNAGYFKSIARILKSDGVIIDAAGLSQRARTGCDISAIGDLSISVTYKSSDKRSNKFVRVRAAIPLPTNEGQKISLLYWLTKNGVSILPDGTFATSTGQIFSAVDWPEDSTPFDTIEMQNWVVTGPDGQPYTPPWIADLPEEDERANLRVVGEMPSMGFPAV